MAETSEPAVLVKPTDPSELPQQTEPVKTTGPDVPKTGESSQMKQVMIAVFILMAAMSVDIKRRISGVRE